MQRSNILIKDHVFACPCSVISPVENNNIVQQVLTIINVGHISFIPSHFKQLHSTKTCQVILQGQQNIFGNFVEGYLTIIHVKLF